MSQLNVTEFAQLASELSVSEDQIRGATALLRQGVPIPYMARFCQQETGGLDEAKIRRLQVQTQQHRALHDRRQAVLRSLEGQGKLTDELKQELEGARTLRRVDIPINLPFAKRIFAS